MLASTASAQPAKPTKRAKPAKKALPAKVVAPACNADEHDKRGNDLLQSGQYYAAHAEYQKAIACSPTEIRYLRAGYVLCVSNRCKPTPPQVKRYLAKLTLSTNKDKLVQACTYYDCGWPPDDD